MQNTLLGTPYWSIRLAGVALHFDSSWLVIIPASLWVFATVYVPILGAALSGVGVWTVAVLVVLLCGVSLFVHVITHIGAARLTGSELPLSVPVYPLGDAAQVWPAAPTPRRDTLVAVVAPFTNLLLAGLAYELWDAQVHPYLNISMPILIFFNGALAALNFIPAFPLDGGRLLRAIWWGLLLQPWRATGLARYLGYLFTAMFTGWAIYWFFQGARSSIQTGVVTLVFAGLMLLGLQPPAWIWNRPQPDRLTVGSVPLLRLLAAWLLFFILFGLTLSYVPIDEGLEIPGVAPSVAPMVELPPQYRHPAIGQFILTTVILQTPITLGQWAYARWHPEGSRLVRLVPPERIVPPDTTAQELARQQVQVLEESEATAIAVGLRLAGYEADIKGNGVRVLTILPESAARNLLQPGDVIVGINGEPVDTTAALTNRLQAMEPDALVQMQILRGNQSLEVMVPLLPPIQPDGAPRIGIAIESAGVEVQLPFPVDIVPQKIVGGPSAGLMFTLTVYNLVTPDDLTGGHTIAGTGTIDIDGRVGPIGGVGQKVVGAEYAGAIYFLSPPENYADALAAARTIEVVEVATAEEAIQFLRSLSPVEEGNVTSPARAVELQGVKSPHGPCRGRCLCLLGWFQIMNDQVPCLPRRIGSHVRIIGRRPVGPIGFVKGHYVEFLQQHQLRHVAQVDVQGLVG